MCEILDHGNKHIANSLHVASRGQPQLQRYTTSISPLPQKILDPPLIYEVSALEEIECTQIYWLLCQKVYGHTVLYYKINYQYCITLMDLNYLFLQIKHHIMYLWL